MYDEQCLIEKYYDQINASDAYIFGSDTPVCCTSRIAKRDLNLGEYRYMLDILFSAVEGQREYPSAPDYESMPSTESISNIQCILLEYPEAVVGKRQESETEELTGKEKVLLAVAIHYSGRPTKGKS